MPLKKKKKFRNMVIFWLTALAAMFLMVYVPKLSDQQRREIELY
jgi:hypothetical protein